ncbi:MAG: hypothetical protein ACW98J_00345 [Candidatus Thorarchaeota archaeon]
MPGVRFRITHMEWLAIGVCGVISFLPINGMIFDIIQFILYASLLGFVIEKSRTIRFSSDRLTKYISIIAPTALLGSFFLYQIFSGAIEDFSYLVGLIMSSFLFLFIYGLGAFLKRYLVTKRYSGSQSFLKEYDGAGDET